MGNINSLKKLKDKKFYLENFVKIKGKKPGALIPFKLKEAQKDLFNTVNKHNRVIILKSRQMGFSTAMVGYFYVDTITNPGTTTAIIGYNSDLTAELLDKVKTFYRTTPPSLRPTMHYNSKYEMSFPTIDSKILVLPSTVNVGRGYTLSNCLAGDTEIIMEDNKCKKIVEIKEGEVITNGNGGQSKVVEVLKQNGEKKDMLSFNVYGSNKNLEVTSEHEIFVRGGYKKRGVWKMAKDLKVGDAIGYPYQQCRNRKRFFHIPNGKKAGYEKRGTILLNRDIKVSEEFGEFCGWFLAEGSVTGGRLSLSIHKDEVKHVLDVCDCIKEFVGKISVSKSKISKTAIIQINGKEFSTFISNLFGKGCSNKRLPRVVWNCGYDFAFGLLRGLIDGDGYIKNDRRVVITSTSYQLLLGVKKLMVSTRIGLATISKSESFRYGKKGLDRYDLSINGKGNHKLRRKLGYKLPSYNNNRSLWKEKNHPTWALGHGRWVRGKFHYWAKIRSIKKIKTPNYVYDIVLKDEPHSVLTTSGCVHNCLATELSSWDDAEEKMMTLEASVPIEGKLVIESTPKSVGNLYHRMWMAKDNGYVKKKYGWNWGYTREEIEMIKKRMNNPRLFAQEYGLEFLSSGRPVFDSKVIMRQRKNVIDLGDVVEETTKGMRVLSKEELEKKTIEDKKTLRTIKDDDGLIMYREPKMGGFYIVGADISEGVEGGDYSVATIWDRTTGEEVASYRGLLPPDVFGTKLDKWGRKYGNALMVVEVNNHGLTTLTILKQLMYPNLYFRPSKYEVLGSPISDKIGWRTTKVTRNIMIDEFAQMLRDNSLIIHSKNLLDEMSVFVYNDAGNMVPLKGYHDDSLFSAAIGLQGFKQMYHKELTQIDYTDYMPSNFKY